MPTGSEDYNTQGEAQPGSSLNTQALDKSRQGTPALPAGTPDAGVFPVGQPRPPYPPGQGDGPSGYSTGKVAPRSPAKGGSNPGTALARPPGSVFPGSGAYAPPGIPPGGNPPAPLAGSAPADGPYLLSSLDSRLPNGQLVQLVIPAAVPPADNALLWLDTSAATPTMRYFDGSNWVALAQAGTATTGGSDANYTFFQSSPAMTWTIMHNLAKYCSVVVVDSGKNVVIGDVRYDSANQCTLSFSAPFSGTAYLN